MNFNIISGGIATQNTLFGMIDIVDFNININELEPEQKQFHDDFVAVYGTFNVVNISNCPNDIEMNRSTTEAVTMDELSIDYDLQTVPNKLIIDNFISIL